MKGATMGQRPNPVGSRDDALELLIDVMLSAGPVASLTDKYFSHSRQIVEKVGDCEVIYAIFLRRRVIAALEPAKRLVKRLAPNAEVKAYFEDGAIVPSETKIMEIRGPYSELSEVETLVLQKIGVPCVCANNAYEMCRAMPGSAFLDMHARHASGPEMNLLAAYGASVGSEAAKVKNGEVTGFVGSSQDLTAPFFGALRGSGTMPHALVGYTGGDVVESLKLFADTHPQVEMLVGLVDYNGREVTDSLRSADWFFKDAKIDKDGRKLAVRLDTHGGRFAEGLDYETSVQAVGEWLDVQGEYNIVEQVLGARAFQLDASNMLVDQVRRILFGKGVSVASIIHVRRALNDAGHEKVLIVASSGFDSQKCQVMGATNAPVDFVGTGSFMPATMSETYATADIISYDGVQRVKVGREHLF
jgi:nicotinate phosphoribosyltransferase